MSELSRCRSGKECAEGETLRDPDTGERLGRAGVLLREPGLCEGCVRRLESTLDQLPDDVAELGDLLEPSMTTRYRDPRLPAQPHVMTSPQAPIRLDVMALQELICWEAEYWAEAACDAAEVPWHPAVQAPIYRYARTLRACNTLRELLGTFVTMGRGTRPARSLGYRRGDGFDPDETRRYGDDIYTPRDGIDGALRLIDLHNKATRYAGKHPGDRVLTPCPRCHHRALIRLHKQRQVECRACHYTWKERDFDDLMGAVYDIFGVDQ